jgi:hypothetical protein
VLGLLRTCVLRASAHNRECNLLVVLPPPGTMLLCELLQHLQAFLGVQPCEPALP